MKTQKRILVALVACLLWMMTFLPWASADIIFQPQAAEMIGTTNVIAKPQGGGRIDAAATINCNYPVDTLGFSYIRLQELRSGTWTTVKSVASKYSYNASTYSYTFTYYGTPGMQYRTQAGFYAHEGIDTETCSETSNTITCN